MSSEQQRQQQDMLRRLQAMQTDVIGNQRTTRVPRIPWRRRQGRNNNDPPSFLGDERHTPPSEPPDDAGVHTATQEYDQRATPRVTSTAATMATRSSGGSNPAASQGQESTASSSVALRFHQRRNINVSAQIRDNNGSRRAPAPPTSFDLVSRFSKTGSRTDESGDDASAPGAFHASSRPVGMNILEWRLQQSRIQRRAEESRVTGAEDEDDQEGTLSNNDEGDDQSSIYPDHHSGDDSVMPNSRWREQMTGADSASVDSIRDYKIETFVARLVSEAPRPPTAVPLTEEDEALQKKLIELRNEISNTKHQTRRRFAMIILLGLVLLAATLGGVLGTHQNKSNDNNNDLPLSPPRVQPTGSPTVTMRPSLSSYPSWSPSESAVPTTPPTTVVEATLAVRIQNTQPMISFSDPPSAQKRALNWMANDPYTLNTPLPDAALIQRFLIVSLAFSMNVEVWASSVHWLAPINECNWASLSCNSTTGAVQRIVLGGVGLSGSIPPEIGLLNQLTYLNLFSNQLSGPLPTELGALTATPSQGLL